MADDDASDSSDVFRFRLWSWDIRGDEAKATLQFDWIDFNGDYPPGEEYGWDRLLYPAVDRLRRVKYDMEPFEPVIVGR